MHRPRRTYCEPTAHTPKVDVSARPIRGVSNMTRIHSATGFAIILAACLAGAFHLSGWFICAATAALVLVSLRQHHAYYGRYANQENLSAQSMLLAGSTLNAATASVIAFALGRAIGWLWGI